MTNSLNLSIQVQEKKSTILVFIPLFVAIISLSIAGILIRFSTFEINYISITFNRLWIATLAFALWECITNRNTDLFHKQIDPHELGQIYTYKTVFLLMMATMSASLGLLLWNWSLSQTSIGNATLMRNFYIIFTPGLGWLLLKHIYNRQFLLGMIVAIAGVILIAFEDLQIAESHLIGDLSALLSALMISIFFLIAEKLRKSFNTTTILLWRCGLGTLLILPLFLQFGNPFFPYSVTGWLTIIAQAVICQGLGQGLLVYSLKRLSSGFISLAVPLEVVFASIFAWIIFSETISFLNWLGFAIVLLGIYLAKSSKSSLKT
jgi:drug/metabolite transporter (DMT)-like permease